MLYIIVDGYCENTQSLSKTFRIPLNWQSAVMTIVNQGHGVGHLLAVEQGITDGQWLIATPIVWQATHNDAMITDICREPRLEDFKAFQQFLAQDGARLISHVSGLWLFEVTQAPPLISDNLEAVMHQSLFPYLEAMPSYWRTWFTEAQMLWSQVPGTSINGIWPWGGGEMAINKPLYALEPHLWPDALGPIKIWDSKCRLKKQDAVLLLTASQWQQFSLSILKSEKQIQVWWNNGIWEHSRPFWKFWI